MKLLSLRFFSALLLCIIFGGMFAYIARSIRQDTINDFDERIINIVQGWEASWLTSIMKTFTFIGSTTVVMLLIIAVFTLLLFGLRNRSQAFFFFFVMIGTGVLNQSLKMIFKRERPDFHRLIEITGYSFPSGHTMMAFSLYAVSAYILWRHIRTTTSKMALLAFVIVMFGMIAISRIYLGVHYPSDVVGAIAVSAFWLIVATAVYDFTQRRRPREIA